MSGLERLPLERVPQEWSAKWFADFVRDELAKADVRNATGSGGITISGSTSTFATISLNTGYTVAALPAGVVGMRAYVTNALAPAFGVAVAGGGAVTIPVFHNGAAWIVG